MASTSTVHDMVILRFGSLENGYLQDDRFLKTVGWIYVANKEFIGIPTKNVIIIVVTVTGCGVKPNNKGHVCTIFYFL